MSVEATTGLRILASLLILIPAVVGLVLHTLLAFSLYKGWRTFGEVSFYVITVQLQCCDVCALLLDLYVAFPLTLTGNQYMGDSIPLYYGPLLFEGVAFNGLFLFSFVLSSNRFLLFLFPKLHNMLFTRRGTRIVALIVWIYVLLFIGLSNVFGCRKQFNKDVYEYPILCDTLLHDHHVCHYLCEAQTFLLQWHEKRDDAKRKEGNQIFNSDGADRRSYYYRNCRIRHIAFPRRTRLWTILLKHSTELSYCC